MLAISWGAAQIPGKGKERKRKSEKEKGDGQQTLKFYPQLMSKMWKEMKREERRREKKRMREIALERILPIAL